MTAAGFFSTHIGEIAGITVSLLWSVGSLLFVRAAARVGAFATNLVRLSIAATVLVLLHTFSTGSPLPLGAGYRAILLLVVSSVLGLVLGDYAYFRALQAIGPRRATLIASLAPVFTAFFGLAVLGERVTGRTVAGMAMTLAGTAWVVLERSAEYRGLSHTLAGTLFGLGAALGQASGLVLSKLAMADVEPLSAAVVRMVFAALATWALAAVLGKARTSVAAFRDRRTLLILCAAATVGPVCGVTLSLVSVAHAKAAVAATLMSLVPIFILPLVWLVDGERPSARAVAGAVLAVAGVAVLVSR